MMMSTVVAVALGLTPVQSEAPQVVRVDEAKMAAKVGRYTQSVDKYGKTRLRGYDPLGRTYDLAIDSNGHVQGEVGNFSVTFDIKDAI
jgi:hypothetical protein